MSNQLYTSWQASSSMSSINCTQFRPHHLRPDKCRNCFGDKSRHQMQQQQEAEVQQQATSEKKQSQDDEVTRSKNGQDTSQSREELLADLKQCHEDRAKLRDSNEANCSLLKEKDQLIGNCKSEIEQLKSRILKEGEMETFNCEGKGKADNDGKLEQEIEKLVNELRLAESQRDQARNELRSLEREMEEMHDNFKEEESEQFEQLKQELDLATKNCKILQIRLNKSERQYGQLEQIKSMLEHQLEEWSNRQRSAIINQDRQGQSESTATNGSGGGGFAQLGDDFVKISSREYDQLLRDLNDTIERERDLQEQIKYSQEEAQMKSDRLQAVEAENEVLLNKVNKLTLANSRLRSNPMRCASMELASVDSSPPGVNCDQKLLAQQFAGNNSKTLSGPEACDLIQQTEQLKLALDLAQSEVDRLRHKCQETMALAEAREISLKECELRIAQLEQELATGNVSVGAGASAGQQGSDRHSRPSGEMLAKLELECRHLRTRLVHSERECKQLKAELSQNNSRPSSYNPSSVEHNTHPRLRHSLSMESGSTGGSAPPGEQAKLKEIVRQLREECNSLMAQNKDLEAKLEHLSTNQNVGGTKMESDLLDKLKKQLEASEQELAKTKSRLVELDLEHTRLQRQHKRLLETADGNANESDQQTVMGSARFGARKVVRKVRIPPEQQRDSMGRQELRKALKDLEAEADELATKLLASECLLDELRNQQQQLTQGSSPTASSSEAQEQKKTLRRLLDQERLLSSNLKLDVVNLEQLKLEAQTNVQMLERERVAMEEELDKLRQVNSELDLSLEEAKRNYRSLNGRFKDAQVNSEKLRDEMAKLKSNSSSSTTIGTTASNNSAVNYNNKDRTSEMGDDELEVGNNNSSAAQQQQQQMSNGDVLLLMRDLSELKVKNGFLIRQLEIAREDTGRQLNDLRQAHEVQQRRAVELAQIELKEKHLAEGQQLRDELNELKQRLANSQRQATRNEEEASGERDRLRSMERDWRRDKSQWQQRLEQSEAQLSIERRSNEYKSKEWESMVRDKERELISVQDKYVQLERDFKRIHNKYSLLEESSESKQKNLLRDLEIKKRELSQLMESNQKREDEYYDNCKRFNHERATLMETLESIKRSYDEKLAELKSSKELLALRQEQSYKERLSAQEEIEKLGDQLVRMSEYEGQVKMLRLQLQASERTLETLKRDYAQLKEERVRLKGKCEELERRCHRYEKQELIAKTSHISSSSSTNFLRNPFHSQQQQQQQQQHKSQQSTTPGGRKTRGDSGTAADDESEDASSNGKAGNLNQNNATDEMIDSGQCMMVEKLTSKINDQRHLINMLKQQNEALQLEVKQLRLIQSSDKIRWQGRVNQLQSRLNSCEEKLLFETQLLNRDTFEGARRKLEVQWAEERQMSLETIKQQQAQNDLFTRDLKKLGQAHELLRLQSKQLESHNNKLSRRLIEYQQQQLQVASLSSSSSNHELEACLSRQQQLMKQNSLLVALMRDEAKPLIETVTKIVASLDVPEPLKQQQQQQQHEPDTPSSAEAKQVDPMLALSSDSARLNSTHRPLVTGGTSEKKLVAPDAPDLITSAKPASAKASTSQSPSRFARLLGKQPKGNTNPSEPGEGGIQDLANKASASSGQTTSGGTAKTVKRVRVKSSALGITLAEKKQLKRHLEQLASALDNLNSELDAATTGQASIQQQQQQPSPQSTIRARNQRASSSPVNRTGEPAPIDMAAGSRIERPHSFSRERDSDSGFTAAPGRVRWQLQADSSDLDSNKSWSASGGLQASNKSNQQQQQQTANTTNTTYRRFPQSTPSSYGASLTDYESESSLASYDDLMSTTYSTPGGGSRRFTSGAESDSCVGQQTVGSGKLKPGSKKRTLKTRLTNTLRNISRSITGLASDSESESLDGTGAGRAYRRHLRGNERRPIDAAGHLGQQQLLDDNSGNNATDHEVKAMREIRV